VEGDSFDVKVYYLYDVPTEVKRTLPYGTTKFLIALSGSFDVVLKDGKSKKVMTLTNLILDC
jgi:hypothetical protein